MELSVDAVPTGVGVVKGNFVGIGCVEAESGRLGWLAIRVELIELVELTVGQWMGAVDVWDAVSSLLGKLQLLNRTTHRTI